MSWEQVLTGTCGQRGNLFVHPPSNPSLQAKQLCASSPNELTEHQSKVRVLSKLVQVNNGEGFLLGAECR